MSWISDVEDLVREQAEFSDLLEYKLANERKRIGKYVKNNKKLGRRAETEIKKALRDAGFFVTVKGVSTAGVDVLAIKDNTAVLIEVKATAGNMVTIYDKQIKIIFMTCKDISSKTDIKPIPFIAVKFNHQGWYIKQLLSSVMYPRIKVKLSEIKLLKYKQLVEYFEKNINSAIYRRAVI